MCLSSLVCKICERCSQRGVELPRYDVVLENLFPVEMDGSLAVPNEPDALLHKCANIEVVRVAGANHDNRYERMDRSKMPYYALMRPHRPIFFTDMIISFAVSGTSVSSISVLCNLCAIDLGSWKVPDGINQSQIYDTQERYQPASMATSRPPGTSSCSRLTMSVCSLKLIVSIPVFSCAKANRSGTQSMPITRFAPLI